MPEIKNAIDRQVIDESTRRLADVYYRAVSGRTRLRQALTEAYGAGAGAYLEAIGMRVAERIAEIEKRPWGEQRALDQKVIAELHRVLNLMGVDLHKEGV